MAKVWFGGEVLVGAKWEEGNVIHNLSQSGTKPLSPGQL